VFCTFLSRHFLQTSLSLSSIEPAEISKNSACLFAKHIYKQKRT